jgi:hypothetical protein
VSLVRLDRLRPNDALVSPFGYDGTWIVAYTFVAGTEGDIEVDLFTSDDTDFLNLHADVSDQVERIDEGTAATF